MKTYTEIRRITGNNKGYAAAALNTLTETCWWVENKPCDVIYLRSADNNDWVAIPDAYTDEITSEIENNPHFTTTSGKTVYLSADANANYIAIEAE